MISSILIKSESRPETYDHHLLVGSMIKLLVQIVKVSIKNKVFYVGTRLGDVSVPIVVLHKLYHVRRAIK